MWMIQLQYADQNENNCGGLYLNVDAIAAVRAGDNRIYKNSTVGRWCHILMVDGTEYKVFNDLTEVLDDINRILVRRTNKE